VAVIGKAATSLLKKGWNGQEIKNIQQSADLLYNVATPVPKGLPYILMVDSNGEDGLTRDLYLARKEYLKDYVKRSKYKNYLITLNKVNQEDFQNNLEIESLRLVSCGGHGGIEVLYGHSRPEWNFSPILTSQQVIENEVLVKDKIFHSFACGTGTTRIGALGTTVVNDGGAIAFIGYNEGVYGVLKEEYDTRQMRIDACLSSDFLRWRENLSYMSQYVPDCKIVQALIEGKTVEEAVNLGKLWYGKLAFKYDYLPTIIGFVKHNREQLVYHGNGQAILEAYI